MTRFHQPVRACPHRSEFVVSATARICRISEELKLISSLRLDARRFKKPIEYSSVDVVLSFSSRIIGLSDADESDDRGPRFTDPYSDALKQSARSIEERSEDDACYMPRC